MRLSDGRDWTLPPEEKKAWVEALRSGKYKQGRGRLRVDITVCDSFGQVTGTESRYCCLGIKAELMGALTVDGSFESASGILYNYKGSKNISYCAAADDVPGAAACEIENFPYEVQRNLWQRNDGTGGFGKHSFEQIADWIDANL